MCGIAGFILGKPEMERQQLQGQLQAQLDQLRHRGPDGQGIWLDERWGLAIGHRLLNIMDSGPGAAQPGQSSSGRYTWAFNGEIYNFRELRARLETLGHRFQATGDSEVLGASLEEWDITETLEKLDGMYALTVWDAQLGRLHLVSDRMGEKPLYWSLAGGDLVFASELRGLEVYPKIPSSVNQAALGQFLRYGCIPAPHCILEGVQKLLPATLLTYEARTRRLTQKRYWAASPSLSTQASQEQVESFHSLLKSQLSQRCRAAVPVGVFLSGGVDSSLVAALAQAELSRPLPTFSIGFEHSGLDEAPFARKVARFLGCQHHEDYLSGSKAADISARLGHLYDEPFADSSQIATHHVACLARSQVGVVLTGDGGDELFLGYSRYEATLSRWRTQLRASSWSGRSLHTLAGWLVWLLQASRAVRLPWLRKVARALPERFPAAKPLDLVRLYRHQTTLGFIEPAEVLAQLPPPEPPFYEILPDTDLARLLGLWDLGHYLPNDILVKVDRATMAVGLEARAPFLSRSVVEAALALPPYPGTGKRVLKGLLQRYLPASLFERPKQGFSVPLGDWLRGPMKAWAEELLRCRCGYLKSGVVENLWRRHLAGEELDHAIWVMLMFRQWLRVRNRL